MAWHGLGWEPVAFAEIEPFPCAVLAHHYPHVPNLGDVTKITEEQIKAIGKIDLVVFGSPCQDLSVAGARKGFINEEGNETRSGLFITAIRLIRWARRHNGCRFALWENVPGAFSSNKGADFARVVGEMAGLDDVGIPKNGWGTEGAAVGDNGMLEWACLDAQWSGLAQRRKRVFAIVDFGDWSGRPPILLERHSLRGDTPPSRKAGQEVTYDVAPRLTSSGRGVERAGDTRGQDPVVAVSVALRGRDGGATAELGNDVSFTIRASGGGGDKPHVLCMAHGQGRSEINEELCLTLNCNHEQPIAFYHSTGAGYWQEGCGTLRARPQDSHENLIVFPERLSGTQCVKAEDLSPSLGAINPMAVSFRACGQDGFTPDVIAPPICSSDGGGSGVPATQYGMVVRRLTPRECERLQGFPDNFTLIPVRGKPASDGPRYKSIGNSMARHVMLYIGKRINLVLLNSGRNGN